MEWSHRQADPLDFSRHILNAHYGSCMALSPKRDYPAGEHGIFHKRVVVAVSGVLPLLERVGRARVGRCPPAISAFGFRTLFGPQQARRLFPLAISQFCAAASRCRSRPLCVCLFFLCLSFVHVFMLMCPLVAACCARAAERGIRMPPYACFHHIPIQSRRICVVVVTLTLPYIAYSHNYKKILDAENALIASTTATALALAKVSYALLYTIRPLDH
jgi:hypothetical protein